MKEKEPWKTKPTHLVLLALKNGPKHGYEITKYIEEKTSGYFSVSYGSLYPVLHELEQNKLIEGKWESLGKTKQKKVYHLTMAGQGAMKEVSEEYRQFIVAFNQLLEARN